MPEKQEGQAGILLVLIMSVVGVISVAVASRTVDTLRTQEIDDNATAAFKAAEAGLDLALLNRANQSGSLGSTNTSFQATYDAGGGAGFVVPEVVEGDVAQVSLQGATGVNAVNLYWNGTAAIKIMVISGDTASATYGVNYYSYDPNAARVITNKFTLVTPGSFSYKGVSFANRVNLNLATITNPGLIRVTVLYADSPVAFEPLPAGSSFAAGQQVTISSVGTVDNNIKSKVVVDRFADKLPVIFDNVLYTKGVLTQ